MDINIAIVVFYLIIVLVVGMLFKKRAGDVSGFFRGGGKMLWWMIGGTTFMTMFSAWSFTGAASKAYTDGFPVFAIFFANAFAFYLGSRYFAKRFRQMRVVTPMEAVRLRYGPVNEQVFTWLQVPFGVISAGLWLNALAVFFSAYTGIDIKWIIIVTGAVVLIMSYTGGSWAVVASDFLQMLIVMSVSIVATIAAFYIGGGPVNIVREFPRNFWIGGDVHYVVLVFIWIIAQFFIKSVTANSIYESTRTLCAKDSKNASKGAKLASILMIIGPFIWFTPPILMASLVPDLAAPGYYPNLGSKASEAAFLGFVDGYLPYGMVGILLVAIFSATMSSMDSGLNRSAGIIIRSFYLPIFKKGKATEKEQIVMSHRITLFLGILIILISLFIASLRELSLFQMMMQLASLLMLPLAIPLFCSILVKKVPDWAAWSTVLVGLFVSYLVKFHLTGEFWSATLALDPPLSVREGKDLLVSLSIGMHLTITLGWFLLTKLFYKEPVGERKEEIERFFGNVNTEVTADEDGASSGEIDSSDKDQKFKMGLLVGGYGIFIALLFFIPNEIKSRFAFIFCGAILITVGILLLRSSGKIKTALSNMRKKKAGGE